MALIFMPRRSAFIFMLVLGIICLVDGIVKKDTKELLVASAILIYAVVSLITNKKKKIAGKDSGKA
jgi:hypothetical protein